MSIDPISEAYREGFQSFAKNKGKYINPYPKGDARHNEFEGGWSQRIKSTAHFVVEDFEKQRRADEEFEAKQSEKNGRRRSKPTKTEKASSTDFGFLQQVSLLEFPVRVNT